MHNTQCSRLESANVLTKNRSYGLQKQYVLTMYIFLCLYFLSYFVNLIVDRPHNHRIIHHKSGGVPQLMFVDLVFRTWKILLISHLLHCAMLAMVGHHLLQMFRSPTQWLKVCVPNQTYNCMYTSDQTKYY